MSLSEEQIVAIQGLIDSEWPNPHKDEPGSLYDRQWQDGVTNAKAMLKAAIRSRGDNQ